jgi:hypothetical protein
MIEENRTTVSFNEKFFSFLEHHLSKTLENLANNKFDLFWCDGVAIPFVDAQLTKTHIANTKKIITEAWMGPTGQDKYAMEIKLGPRSLERCLNDNGLEDCLPANDSMDWISLDISQKNIEIRLK